LNDITAVIPVRRGGGNKEWLEQAVRSLGDIPHLIVENDGEVGEARNHGMREATTEFVQFIDADDVAAPGMVDELYRAIWDVDVTYPQMFLVSEDLSEPLGLHEAQPFCPMRLEQGNFVPGCALVRREKALAVGGFRELPILEDWDLWLRMSRAGAKFKGVPAARLYYRQVEGSRNKNADVDWAAVADQITGPDRTRDALATFYYSPTPAVAYLRCVMPARHLPGVAREGMDIAFGPNGEHEFVGHRGTAVFQLGSNHTVATIAAQMKQDGIRVLVETDDNYVAGGSKRFREKAQWGEKIGDRANTVGGHKAILSHPEWGVDGVIVTTEYLASQYRKLNPNVFVCPNQVDPDDWQPLKKPDDGVFRIGWFASQSHAGDERLITKALRWASKQKEVEVVTLGYQPRWDFRFRALPWATDLSAYRKAMQILDVGVAPIVPTPFTRGRSDLKWLEHSMAGAASVVSDVDSYDTVPQGLALKASDADGFYKQIRRLVQNRDEARELAAAAREYVLAERTIGANIDKWKEAVAA
jgi:hypothetical protein